MTASRPNTMTDDENRLYDWFAANGVDEWLPDDFGPIEIDTSAGTLTYTAFTIEPGGGERGWEQDWIGTGTERRTVPLVEPLPDDVRAIVERAATKVADTLSQRLDRMRQRAADSARDHESDLAEAERGVLAAERFAKSPVVVA